MSGEHTHPERLLQSFGIEHPRQIDLEAIAWELGARIRTRELHSCEARIVGSSRNAIITVDGRQHPRRQRFSIAHELGHWQRHRGRCLVCRTEDIGSAGPRSAGDPERVADEYASDLILPRYLLKPILEGVPRLTMKSLTQVADEFQASKTATLRKIVALDRYPVMMVSTKRAGRRYFQASPQVPATWFPRADVAPESQAFEMVYGNKPEASAPRPVKASAWFDRSDAGGRSLMEQSYRVAADEVITILTFTDPKMLT